MIIDLLCLIFSIRWIKANSEQYATILHAFRVLIYVLGRTGPWINFDVNPEFHSSYVVNWFWVYFAAILSILGIIGVIIIWLIRRKLKENI